MTEEVTKPALPDGWLAVDALDIDAQGVARRADGKVVFIDGALPGELVSADIRRLTNKIETIVLDHVRQKHRSAAGTENQPVRLRLIEEKGA